MSSDAMPCPGCGNSMSRTSDDFVVPMLPADHVPILDPPEITGEVLARDRWDCPGHYRHAWLRRHDDPVVVPEVESW